jgi:pyruvate dehydrogenase (quinone)/pyruvate oxidase
MPRKAADVLVETLQAWGVEVVFGLPGDGINGIMEALRQRRDRIRFVQTRHEEAAAFAAVGYAKFSGKLGVCLATTGPGATHLLTGLYDAQMDQVPVLAITGLPYHDLIGTHYQQDVATDRLFRDVALYSERIMGPLHVKTVADHAIRAALVRRGVAHIAFPNDFQDQAVEDDEPSQMNQPAHTASDWWAPRLAPPAGEVRRAAEILNAGRKVAIVLGAGARGARAEIEELAELLGAPVAKALLGKDVLPDESPYTTGGIGVLGTKPTGDVMKECDTLLLIGTSFPYIKYLPEPKKVRAVQIDTNAERIGIRFPVECGLVGDAGETLRALRPLLQRNGERAFLERAQASMREWWGVMEERAAGTEHPMRPQAFAAAVGRALADDAIICADSGQNTFYAAREIRIRGEQRFSCSGLLASMGCGLTYAIGAQIAFPQRQVVVFTGDGGLSMVMAELASCALHRLPVKVFVMKNNVLGMIRWEQMMFLGNPEYGVELQEIDFAKVAEACGVRGFKVDRAEDAPGVIAEALRTPGPALVEATVDPFEPIMPGTLKPEQAAKYAEALRRGQPNGGRIALTLYRDAIEDFAENAEALEKALREKT